MSSSQALAYRYLRKQIFQGALQPGARVSDYSLSPRIGVSRTPVREAIRQLQAEGLIDQHPGGARVRLLTGRDMVDLIELREAIEVFCVRQAVPRLTAVDMAELRTQCEAMRQCALATRQAGGSTVREPIGERPIEADVRFHMVFIKRCGNARMLKLLGDLYLLSRTSIQHHRDRTQGPSLLRVLAWIWADHLRIYQAAERGDIEAAANRMSEHIRFYPRRVIPQYAVWADRDDPADEQGAPSLAERWLLGDSDALLEGLAD